MQGLAGKKLPASPSTCWRKVKYSSPIHAAEELEKMLNRVLTPDSRHLTIYPCGSRKHWHIGRLRQLGNGVLYDVPTSRDRVRGLDEPMAGQLPLFQVQGSEIVRRRNKRLKLSRHYVDGICVRYSLAGERREHSAVITTSY